MFKIRKEQMEVFETDCRRRFLARVVSMISSEFPDRFANSKATREFVENGIREANDEAFDDLNDVLRYIQILALVGANLRQKPKFSRILNQLSWQGSDKVLDKLYEAAESLV